MNIKSKDKITILIKIVYGGALLLGLGYLIYIIVNGNNQTNQLFSIINSFLLVIIIILYGILGFANTSKLRQMMAISTSIVFIILISFNLLINTNIIKLPTEPVVPDFNNKSINGAINWASKNNIEYELDYEYSDNLIEFNVIYQNILPNTPLKDVNKIKFTVSSGPNYDKKIVIPKMINWNIDDVLKVINENFLNNVEIDRKSTRLNSSH